MKPSDVRKIKAHLSPTKFNLTSINGAYISNGTIASTFRANVGNMRDEMQKKVLSWFRKVVACPDNTHLLLDVVPSQQGTKLFLDLRKTVTDPTSSLYQTAFGTIVAAFPAMEGDFLALVIAETMAADKETEFQFSAVVVCPIKKQDGDGVAFSSAKNNLVPDEPSGLQVGAPCAGFIYPMLEDGQVNFEHAMIYGKGLEAIRPFFHEIFGVVDNPFLTVNEQKDQVGSAIRSEVPDDVALQFVQRITAEVNEAQETGMYLGEDAVLRSLVGVGVDHDRATKVAMNMAHFFDSDSKVDPALVFSSANSEIIIGDGIKIQANSDMSSLIQVKDVDGQRCIVITAQDDVRFNGIPL